MAHLVVLGVAVLGAGLIQIHARSGLTEKGSGSSCPGQRLGS